MDPDLEDLEGVIVDIGTEKRNPLLRLDDADDRHQLEAREGCRGQQRAGGLQAAVPPMALWCERPQPGEDAGDTCSGTSGRPPPRPWTAWPALESEIEEGEQLTGERIADSIKLCVLDSQTPKEHQYLPLLAHTSRGDLCHSEPQDPGLPPGDWTSQARFRWRWASSGRRARRAKASSPRAAASRTRAKTSSRRTRTNTRHTRGRARGTQRSGKQSSGNFQGYCGNCGKWGHPQRECWSKSINNLADSTSASSNSRVDTHNSPGDYGTGAGQGGFAGGIWEHDEDDDDKGWIFSVGGAGWPSGFQGRPGQWCTILIDSGSSATVCGPQHFPDYPIVPSERLALYEPSGKPLQHYGQKEVSFVAEDGQNVNIKFDVANVVRLIVSVGKLQQDGKEVVLGKESYIKECRGRRGVRRLGLFTIAALFFLRLQIAAGCATGPSLGKTTLGTKATDEVWAVEGPEVPGMQADDPEHQVDIFQSENEEVEGPEARGLPAPTEPTKAEVEWHNLTHVPHAPWCSVCVCTRARPRSSTRSTRS